MFYIIIYIFYPFVKFIFKNVPDNTKKLYPFCKDAYLSRDSYLVVDV